MIKGVRNWQFTPTLDPSEGGTTVLTVFLMYEDSWGEIPLFVHFEGSGADKPYPHETRFTTISGGFSCERPPFSGELA